MRLEQLAYVRVIARCQSLSKAARELYLTQPTLSVSLQNLEAELGFPVFDRTRAGMKLTEKGQKLYQIALRIQGELEEISALSLPEEETKRVELAAVPTFCNAAVLQLLQALKKLSPDLELSIREISRRDAVFALVRRRFHLAVGLYTAEEEEALRQTATQNQVVIQPLMTDHMAVFLPKNHPLAGEARIRLAQLAGKQVVLLRESGQQAEEVAAKRVGVNSYSFTERDSVFKAVSKGMGYAILPGLMALDNLYVDTGLVTAVPLAEGAIPTTLYLAYPADFPLTGSERLTMRAIGQVCGELRQRLAQRFPPSEEPAAPGTFQLFY